MSYENERYWNELHEHYRGKLRAVGWPALSEAFNAAKYASETDSFLRALEFCPQSNESGVRILETGIGTGFWTTLLIERLSNRGPRLTGLDISDDALASVRARFPDVELEKLDLRTIDPDKFHHGFDLVTAIMVLLHLTVPGEFANALRFSARSVRPGGTLILYEPAITDAYSPWFSTTRSGGNSMARCLDAYDEPLEREGLERIALFPGASWLLNSPIEAGTRSGYWWREEMWTVCSRAIYRFELLTARLSPVMLRLDAALKERRGGGSAKFLVYRRLEAVS